MKDPKRISKILKIISKIWHKYPNLRLGQLLENVYRSGLYYVEDKTLIKNLQTYYNNYENK